MDYRYYTYDYITSEAHYYFDFDDLKNYLDLYLRRLNEENFRLGENYRYELNHEEDAYEICDAINIELVKLI